MSVSAVSSSASSATRSSAPSSGSSAASGAARPTTQPAESPSKAKESPAVTEARGHEQEARAELGGALGRLEGDDAANVGVIADVSQNLGLLEQSDRKQAIQALAPELTPEQVDKVSSQIDDAQLGPVVQDQLFADAVKQYAAENANQSVEVKSGDNAEALLQSVGHWTPEQIKANNLVDLLGPLQEGQNVQIPRSEMYQLYDASQNYLNVNGNLYDQLQDQSQVVGLAGPPAGQLLDLVA